MMKILITGASGGIGTYLCKEFGKKGDKVFGTYNRTKPVSLTNCEYHKADVTIESEVIEWVKSLPITDNDQIVLINSVGTNYNSVIHKADSEEWKRVIENNLIGVFHCIKNILPVMRERKFGRIINLSSVVPKIGVPGTSAYSASKAALWGLTKAVAAENARYGITVNTINLGYFDIGMIDDVPREFMDEIMKKIPLGKLGNPEDIYKTVCYLIETEYITGSEIDINGGIF